MYHAIKNCIGYCGVTYGVMPKVDGQLAYDDGGAFVVAVIDNFEQITPLLVRERGETEVVQDQDIFPLQGCKMGSIFGRCLSNSKVMEEPLRSMEDGRVSVAACLLSKG